MLFVVFPVSLVSAQDPCNDNVLMDNLEDGRRSPDYYAEFGEPLICDNQLDTCL